MIMQNQTQSRISTNTIHRGNSELVQSKLVLPFRTEFVMTVNGKDGDTTEQLLHDEMTSADTYSTSRFVFAGERYYETLGKSFLKEDGCLLLLKEKARRESEVNSIQATAISGTSLFPLRQQGRNIGVVYEDDYARYCRLSGVIPLDLTDSREGQTRAVLEMLDWILTTNGFSFADTIRTWFYLDQLLDWYKEFNEVRTRFFASHGIFDKLVPASTGIGAANPWGAALACDLFAIQPKISSVRIEAVPSPLQDSALKYASSFSRAVEVHMPSHRSLLISGTASIDTEGNTQYRDNHPLQIERTIEVVTALLKSRKMGWGDVTRGIVYFVDTTDLETFNKVCRTYNIPSFSLAIANADICRHDLFFELEVDAIKLQE